MKIYSKDNILRCEVDGVSGQQEKGLQSDNVLSLSFTLYEYVQFDVNDYVDFCGERYWLMERYKPKMKSKAEWKYDVKLYGIESLIKRFLVVNDADGDNPVFTLTAPAIEHIKLIVKSINMAMGQKLWHVGEVKNTEYLVIDYKGTYCNEALDMLSKAAKTEYWFENGTTLNLNKAAYGEELTLGYLKGLTSLEREKAENVKFYTRLFPMGSSKNIDPAKYGHSRLQLPGGIKYVDKDVDKYGIIHHYEENAFAGIYPRRIGTVSEVRSEEKIGHDGKPFTIYYFKDNGLDFDPNKYNIPNYIKRVSFQEGSELAGQGTSEEHYFEVNYDSDKKEFEIITIFPYQDMQVPGGLLVPKVGDKYILSHLRMPDEYYSLAEQELLDAVKKYNEESFVDNSVYKGDTDHVYIEQNAVDLFVGRRVRLESDKYFAPEGYRRSRITKVTRKIAMPSQVSLEISDAIPVGKIASMENNIEDMKHYAMQAVSEFPDVIESWENDKKPGEHNVFSALRSIKQFLNKNKADTAKELITFLKGIAFTNGAGIDGLGNAVLNSLRSVNFNELEQTGFGFTTKEGKSTLSIGNLIVWGKAMFNELEIRKMHYVGGNYRFSGAGSKIFYVDWLDANGVILDKIDTNKTLVKTFRCYLYADDGTTRTMNLWKAGMQALMQEFNIESGVYKNVANRTYWRLVDAVSSSPVSIVDKKGTDLYKGKLFHFIDLNNKEAGIDKGYLAGSDYPLVGDTIVHSGGRDGAPDGFIDLLTTGVQGFAIVGYSGVNTFSLDDKATSLISPCRVEFKTGFFRIGNNINVGGPSTGKTIGEYIADNAENPYLVSIITDKGNIIRNGQGNVTLTAIVTHGYDDVTDTLLPNQFSWIIETANEDFNKSWNARHEAVGKSIVVSAADVNKKAQINCLINIE